MEKNKEMSSYKVYMSFISILSIMVFSACSPRPIDTILPVVDRIIYETVNELEQVPYETLDGICILNCSQQDIDSSASYIYAKGFVKAAEPGTYRIGFSSNSDCQIQFGDSKIVYLQGSGAINFKETAYGMFISDTLLAVVLDTLPIEVKISLRNRESCTIFLVEEREHEQPIRITFSSWDFAGSEQKWFADDFPVKNWKKEIVQTQSKISTVEDRYFKKEAYNEWTYANGILLNSLLDLYSHTKDDRLREFVESVGNFTLSSLTNLSEEYFKRNALRTANYRMFRKVMLDDTGAPAIPFAELYKLTGNEEYLRLSKEMVEYVSNKQERLTDGTFSRPEPFPGFVWSDDLFMASSLLLKINDINSDTSLINDCILQIERMHHYLWDEENKLHRHGYSSTTQKQSPVCWIRSNGWLLWSIVNVLSYIPSSNPSYKKIMDIYIKSIEGIVKYQNTNGLWHQVLTNPKSFEETSGSAMFVISIARGISNGWLPKEYKVYADKGWKGISKKIHGDKVIDICQGTGIGFDEEFYLNRKRFINDPRGLGAVITCAIELDKLDKFINQTLQ